MLFQDAEACIDPEGGGGGGGGGWQGVWNASGKSQKNIVFFRYTGLDPLENHKATKPAFIVGLSSPC